MSPRTEAQNGPLSGTVAASITPLNADGTGIDPAAVGPLVEHYIEAGLGGILVGGSTGEGLLMSNAARSEAAAAFLAAAEGRLPVAVHVGALTTPDAVMLAAAARADGAAAVASIAPPFFMLDDTALITHFEAIANACAPVPLYLYEHRARTSYAIPENVAVHLRDELPNVVGMKVSNTKFEDVEPYLALGLDVFVGSEPLAARGLAGGAVGCVSGLAAALPATVTAAVALGDDGQEQLGTLRALFNRYPFQAALKHTLALAGLPVGSTVCAPLRGLNAEEAEALTRWLRSLHLDELTESPLPVGD